MDAGFSGVCVVNIAMARKPFARVLSPMLPSTMRRTGFHLSFDLERRVPRRRIPPRDAYDPRIFRRPHKLRNGVVVAKQLHPFDSPRRVFRRHRFRRRLWAWAISRRRRAQRHDVASMAWGFARARRFLHHSRAVFGGADVVGQYLLFAASSLLGLVLLALLLKALDELLQKRLSKSSIASPLASWP